MTTFISILRGINVSGNRKILMADLKAMFEELGFSDVTTYIQSGNVVFNSNTKELPDAIARRLQHEILEKSGFEVPVIVRSEEEMVRTIANNPFLRNPALSRERLHVTFLADIPPQANLDKISGLNFPPDEFIIQGRDIYLHCPESYGNTKLSNAFFESKLKTTATTRNWATINKLLEIARSLNTPG